MLRVNQGDDRFRLQVLGGHVAQKRNWPWLVEISKCKPECDGCTRRQCFLCTGTLVSDRHVLTAAHCFEGIEPEYTKRSN
ncbi:Cul n 11 allergen, partial [Aphelenchoides avenae]